MNLTQKKVPCYSNNVRKSKILDFSLNNTATKTEIKCILGTGMCLKIKFQKRKSNQNQRALMPKVM